LSEGLLAHINCTVLYLCACLQLTNAQCNQHVGHFFKSEGKGRHCILSSSLTQVDAGSHPAPIQKQRASAQDRASVSTTTLLVAGAAVALGALIITRIRRD
jgi:hypothetical protein